MPSVTHSDVIDKSRKRSTYIEKDEPKN